MRIEYPTDYVTLVMGVNGKMHSIFPFVLEELPLLFVEWHDSPETGSICFLPSPGMMNEYAMVEFFGMEVTELLHCFSVNHQRTSSFGGAVLTINSKPADVAKNIFCFLESLSEVDNKGEIATRRVLVEKIMIRLHDVKTKKRRR
ncbi:MAG: hypothetical protein K8R85_07150 [Bacteroidetes bacterium]|nr:hypothetical protein [Bacteroidota bacterium]